MRRVASICAFGAVMTLAACQSSEVAQICAAQGDPATGIIAYAHDASGGFVHLRSDGTTAETRFVTRDLETPIAAAFWSDADHTFQATSRGEVSPCDGTFASYVTVLFDDDEMEERQTSCASNAMARLTVRILSASAEDRPGDDGDAETLLGVPDSVAMACEWAYARL